MRDVVAFALGALIGDINRFANPKKLVAYVGLNPAFDDSGNETWRGGIGGHGRSDLRSLLIESAQSILRTNHPLAKWGKKLLAKKDSYKLAVAAVARRLVVAIWYLMKGQWSRLEQINAALSQKVGKIITRVGPQALDQMGKSRKAYREEIIQSLKRGRTYVLKPNLKFHVKAPPKSPECSSQPSVA